VLSCLLVVMFPFMRCGLSFVLRRLAYVALVYWMFLLYLLHMALRRLLYRLLRGTLLCHFYPLPRPRAKVVVRVRASVVARVAPVLTAPIVTWMVILSPAATRRSVIYVSRGRSLSDLLQLAPPSKILCGSGGCSPLQGLPRQPVTDSSGTM
jgi:hypothetical protein